MIWYGKGDREIKSMTIPKWLACGSVWSNVSQTEETEIRRKGGSKREREGVRREQGVSRELNNSLKRNIKLRFKKVTHCIWLLLLISFFSAIVSLAIYLLKKPGHLS